MAKYQVETEDGTFEIETEDGDQDIGANAIQDVKGIVGGIGNAVIEGSRMMNPANMAEGAMKVGTAVKDALPNARMADVSNMLGKNNLVDNPISRKVATDVLGRTKEIVTDPQGAFERHPVNTALDVSSVVFPAIKALRGAGMAAEAGKGAEVAEYLATKNVPRGTNFLTDVGGQGINRAAGIRPATVEMMAGTENPAKFGANLGAELNKEGAIGLSSGSTFDKANRLKQSFGVEVGDAIDNIRASGASATVSAEEALKPLVDEWTKLADSSFSPNRSAAKLYEDVYTKLTQKAQAAGGQLSFDDVKLALEDAGEALGNVGINSPKLEPLTKLYGKLAQTRGQIVDTVAAQAGDPALATNLRSANAGYSKYADVMPDLRREAAKEGAGGKFDFNKLDITRPSTFLPQSMNTGISKTALKLGDLMESVKRAPQAFGKYAQTLMQAAERGPAAVNAANYLMQQRDPEYNDMMMKALGNDGSNPNE